MYNNTIPDGAELPPARTLLRSTLIALVVAGTLLVTVVLPAEYAIDPTGMGRMLGLTQMGEIKAQLAEEAAADAVPAVASQVSRSAVDSVPPPTPSASEPPVQEPATPEPAWKDEMQVILQPGQGAEIKLVMKAGAKAEFSWAVQGGTVNFDTHGDGGGKSISYEKGRTVPADDGVLVAAFDGNHGWFWRNRGNAPVTVVVRVRGDYSEIKRLI